jgi:hypothetical protein
MLLLLPMVDKVAVLMPVLDTITVLLMRVEDDDVSLQLSPSLSLASGLCAAVTC